MTGVTAKSYSFPSPLIFTALFTKHLMLIYILVLLLYFYISVYPVTAVSVSLMITFCINMWYFSKGGNVSVSA